jgi:hypothetical protein
MVTFYIEMFSDGKLELTHQGKVLPIIKFACFSFIQIYNIVNEQIFIVIVDIANILCSVHTVQFSQDKNHLTESASRLENLAKSLVTIFIG